MKMTVRVSDEQLARMLSRQTVSPGNALAIAADLRDARERLAKIAALADQWRGIGLHAVADAVDEIIK